MTFSKFNIFIFILGVNGRLAVVQTPGSVVSGTAVSTAGLTKQSRQDIVSKSLLEIDRTQFRE